MKKAQGFTLIELSIVLVVIGLIVGGVLVGRDLIHTAEIRATVKQYEQFNAAVNAFRTKYNCLPGDCPSAAAFGFYAGSAGDGDGFVGNSGFSNCTYSNQMSCNSTKEYTNFWYHLSAAALIAYSLPDYDNTPNLPNYDPLAVGVATPPTVIKSPYNTFLPLIGMNTRPGWTVIADISFDPSIGGGTQPPHSFILGAMTILWTSSMSPGFAPRDTWALDQKLDDGYPFSGRIRALQNGSLSNSTLIYSFLNNRRSQNASTYCIDDTVSPAMYNAASAGNPSGALGNCMIALKAGF